MNAFPHEFSAFLSSSTVQSAQQSNSVQQFCLGDVQTGLNFASTKFSDEEQRGKRREGVGVDRKWLHREIERERRKQMKSRYSDLRSLLPQEIIVGKTCITDQLSVATDYISHLQEKLEQLTNKRDEMKMNEIQCYEDRNISFSNCHAFPLVNVNNVGSHVLVTTSLLRNQMTLSTLLLALEQEGLHIISSSSFAPDDNVFHTLHCKVFDKERFTSGTKLEGKILQLIEGNHVGVVSKS